MKSSRKDALQAGDKYYNTGKPCIYGHYSDRMTVDGSCIECRSEKREMERADFRARLAAKEAR